MDKPPTTRRHRAPPTPPDPSLKGREPVKNALWRGLLSAVVLGVAMFGAFRWARSYVLDDWSERVTAAREAGQRRGAQGSEAGARGYSGKLRVPPSRWLARLEPVAALSPAKHSSGTASSPNAWLLAARISRGASAERGLLLALASGVPHERIEFERGRQAFLARRPAEALAAYRRALAVKPGWAPALVGEAIAASRVGRRELALSALSAYLPGDPHNARLLRLTAALLADEGRADDGLTLLERELAAGGDPVLFLDAAQLAARAHRPATAACHLDAALGNGVPLPDIAHLFRSPLFDDFRAAPEGEAFRHRLAAAARARLENP